MGAYRLTRGNFQARFDSLGRLTHVGHQSRIKLQPTVYHLSGDIREGQWSLNAGRDDLHFDIEATSRKLDFAAQTLTLKSEWRGPGAWFGVDLTRTYCIEHDLLRCDFSLDNWMPKTHDGVVTSALPVRRLRYVTGVNCWTDFSSDWAHRPYPTNLRCEQAFFWAAAVSPAHDVLGMFTTGPCDSWRVLYEGPGSQRIRSFAIDFVNDLDAHPTRWPVQHIRLGKDQPRHTGSFYIGLFDSYDAFRQKMADVLNIPLLAPQRCAGFTDETLRLPIVAPRGKADAVRVTAVDEATGSPCEGVAVNDGDVVLPPSIDAGRVVLTLDAGGKRTEARVYRHHGWDELLRTAGRHAALVKRASGYNAESSLGLITVCLAAAYTGDADCRAAAREIIESMYVDHIDRDTGRHTHLHNRLQNYGSLLDCIRVYHDAFDTDEYLGLAHRSAAQLLGLQGSDGNFYNHHVIYNNVIHPVKSLFDWGTHLRSQGRAADADVVHAAVERAYRNLAREGDDSQTEGSDHFEDGMTACSGYQIAALWPHFGKRAEDLAMAEGIFDRRRALKARVPDSRYFGATLRHWEGYWAIGLGEGMLGGHGWNAWSASFSHALFMATGKWRYIIDCYATLANCMQSIDLETGAFNFGFAIDPYWHDYYGYGTQHAGETYVAPPDEITVASESHSAFYTFEHSFLRQMYVRITADGIEVLNGSVVKHDGDEVTLGTHALDLREIVVTTEGADVALPQFRVEGQTPAMVRVG